MKEKTKKLVKTTKTKKPVKDKKQTTKKPVEVTPHIARIRFLVENYYDIQDNRMRGESRNRNWVRDYKIKGVEQKVFNENISVKFKDIETWIYKELGREVKNHVLWEEWFSKVLGIGPALAGGFIAWIGNIKRFETISKLQSYCGLACDSDGNAVRRKKGESAKWHHKLKSHAWKTAKSFVKTKGKYREYYDKSKKAYQKAHPKKIFTGNYSITPSGKKKKVFVYTKLHIDNMAMRKTVKLFLSHLWVTWRELENLPTRSPYPIEKLGHTTYIPPFFDK